MNDLFQTSEDSISEFFRHENMLRDYIRCLVSHRQDAEDIFQEVAIVICRKKEGIPDPEHFGAWCRGIARNLVMHHWRKKGRAKEDLWQDFHDTVDAAYRENDPDLDKLNEQRLILDDCLQKLPRQSRELLETHYIRGVTMVDIANRLQRSAESVRMILMRIRKKLVDCVQGQQLGSEAVHD